jgi:hypothetical protein
MRKKTAKKYVKLMVKETVMSYFASGSSLAGS